MLRICQEFVKKKKYDVKRGRGRGVVARRGRSSKGVHNVHVAL